jgi:hypothetical protein
MQIAFSFFPENAWRNRESMRTSLPGTVFTRDYTACSMKITGRARLFSGQGLFLMIDLVFFGDAVMLLTFFVKLELTQGKSKAMIR